MSGNLALEPVDSVEIISLVDNAVDFLSAVSHKEAASFRQWARSYGKTWMDAHGEVPLAEHGFSMLLRVTAGSKRRCVLFDTGGSPNTVCINAERMGINLSEVDCVVLSHGHHDHCGGLISAINVVGKANLPICVHPNMFSVKGFANSDGELKKYPPFLQENQLTQTTIVNTKEPTLIADGLVCVTGEIPRVTSFEQDQKSHFVLKDGVWHSEPQNIDDRAIAVNVLGKGLVVLSGCAHAGIINTVIYAKQLTGVSSVYGVLGGFHLAGKENEPKNMPTITALAEFKPTLVVPSHCTGWKAMCRFAQALPEAFVWNSVGNRYMIEKPHVGSEELNNNLELR